MNTFAVILCIPRPTDAFAGRHSYPIGGAEKSKSRTFPAPLARLIQLAQGPPFRALACLVLGLVFFLLAACASA
jgi:hypothetical protein